jgi:hypothetical protein
VFHSIGLSKNLQPDSYSRKRGNATPKFRPLRANFVLLVALPHAPAFRNGLPVLPKRRTVRAIATANSDFMKAKNKRSPQ